MRLCIKCSSRHSPKTPWAWCEPAGAHDSLELPTTRRHQHPTVPAQRQTSNRILFSIFYIRRMGVFVEAYKFYLNLGFNNI